MTERVIGDELNKEGKVQTTEQNGLKRIIRRQMCELAHVLIEVEIK